MDTHPNHKAPDPGGGAVQTKDTPNFSSSLTWVTAPYICKSFEMSRK